MANPATTPKATVAATPQASLSPKSAAGGPAALPFCPEPALALGLELEPEPPTPVMCRLASMLLYWAGVEPRAAVAAAGVDSSAEISPNERDASSALSASTVTTVVVVTPDVISMGSVVASPFGRVVPRVSHSQDS